MRDRMALRALGHQRQPVRQGFRRFILFCSFSECRHLAVTEPPVGLQSNEPVSQDLCVLYTTIRGRCADSARHMKSAASAGP